MANLHDALAVLQILAVAAGVYGIHVGMRHQVAALTKANEQIMDKLDAIQEAIAAHDHRITRLEAFHEAECPPGAFKRAGA